MGPDDRDPRPPTEADTEADPNRPARPPPRPAFIGHFEILGVIGSGGMGVVYVARDPTLDRKVAVKVLRHEGSASEKRRARLLREARAMGKLRHPNVVTVHEVGEDDGKVFVVMELVEGDTLRGWLRGAPGWRAVIERLVQAGRGLTAAHEAGLVHRDFKPENVFVGADGRVRVGDFGVVGVSQEAGEEEMGSPAQDAGLTATGVVLGTPRYMAPEQHQARPIDERADQFAFAAVLYEALYGQSPFAGKTLAELRANVIGGRIESPPPKARAPRWLEPIVRRGLRPDPAQRYPSLAAMIAELERGPLLTWGRAGVALGAATLIGVAAWGLLRSQADPCGGAEAKLIGAWDPAVRASLEKAFVASGRPYGADMFARTAGALDAYAGDLVAARTEACQAAVMHKQEGAGARLACLDRRLGALRAQTRVLAAADAEVVDKAFSAVRALEPPEGCASDLGAPPAETPEAQALRGRLDESRAQVRAGKVRAVQDGARGLVDDARRVGDKAVLAEALLLFGEVRNEKEASTAESALEEAAAIAGDRENDRLVAAALVRLLRVVGVTQKRYSDARALRPGVEAAVRRAKDDRIQIDFLRTSAQIVVEEGAHARALELSDQAVALAEKVFGAESLEAARAANDRVTIYDASSDYQRAAREAERLLAIVEKILGPEHRDVSANLNQLGVEEWRLNRYPAAAGHFRRSLRIIEATDGPESLRAASVMQNLALLAKDGKESEAALDYLRRALAIQEKVLGPENVAVANTINAIGNVHLDTRRFDDALGFHRRALAIREKLLPPTHADIGSSTLNIGMVMIESDKPGDAIPWLQRALGIVEKSLPPGHRRILMVMTALADAYVDTGRAGEALALLDRGDKMLVDKPDELARAHLSFSQARALRGAKRDPDRAVRLARAARDKLAGEGEQERKYVERIDQFLAAR